VVPQSLLVVAEPFAAELDGAAVAASIARGLRPHESDLCPLEQRPNDAETVRALLASLDFDARMRRARAVVIAVARLDEETLLRGALAFEVATRARQGGVPAYAIVAQDALDAFDKRVLDLQAVIEAGDRRALARAAKRLGSFV